MDGMVTVGETGKPQKFVRICAYLLKTVSSSVPITDIIPPLNNKKNLAEFMKVDHSNKDDKRINETAYQATDSFRDTSVYLNGASNKNT